MEKNSNTLRLLFLTGGVLVWAVLIAGRLVQLQVFQSSFFLQKAQQQQQGYVQIASRRGDILDRNLEELAVSVGLDSVYCHPRELKDPAGAARQLAAVLQLQESQLRERFTSGVPFLYVKRKITPREAEQVRGLGLRGVYFQKESKRFYPNRELASHVLGFVGVDNVGLAGIEYLLDGEIRGAERTVPVATDARRQILFGVPDAASDTGQIVVLNLDRSIQFIAEKQLAAAVERHRAVGGAAIVMNPNNGEILAMTSYPSYDPNSFAVASPEARRNRAILDTYEPGSTFKIVTASAALEEKTTYPEELINCAVGTVSLGGKVFREAHSSYGVLSFNQILSKSSNVGSIKLGLRLGEERLYRYIRKFHFGEASGLELPGEQSGLLRSPEGWSKLSIGAISIGQEIGVTPIQLVSAFSALANGGEWIQPRIVNRVLGQDGRVVRSPALRSERVLSEDTASKIRAALNLVVEEGTGTQAKPYGYTAAGKTGTAQKFVDGAYSRSRYIASFVGFAPVENPAIVVLVMVDEPKGSIYGGSVAAPVFKEITEQALLRLGLPQQKETQQFAQSLKRKRTPPPIEDGEAVDIRQVMESALREAPELRARLNQGRVVLPLETNRLPDFSGKSVREVARMCSRLGVRLKVIGTGRAVAQRPLPGAAVYSDTVCEVFFNFQPSDQRVSLETDRTAARN